VGLAERGYVTLEELAALKLVPPDGRINRGPVAILECPQAIPCNPCETACSRKAIKVGVPITSLPSLDWNECTGCGICVASCPGQAIFILDGAKSIIGIPHEYIPLPVVGDEVMCLDRSGKAKCTGRIVRVINGKKQDHTAVVYLSVPREHLMNIRGIKVMECDA
jgi:Fe-S-cluster-containing hydrogenase component 2